MGTWAIVRDQSAHEKALELARGYYQRAILEGYESLSGSTLRGNAKRYIGRYRLSSAALLARIADAGIPITEIRDHHGKRILVIG